MNNANEYIQSKHILFMHFGIKTVKKMYNTVIRRGNMQEYWIYMYSTDHMVPPVLWFRAVMCYFNELCMLYF